MLIKASHKGSEYRHRTGAELQDFLTSALSEAAIRRADMDKLWYNLYRIELTSEKPCGDITMDICQIKEGAVSHIDIQYWTDKIWEYIPIIFTNTLIWP